MTLPVGMRGRLTALALLFIVLVLLTRLAVQPMAAAYANVGEDVATGQDALQRYQRIIAELPALKAAASRTARNRPLAPFLLAGSNASLAVANLQQRLQDSAERHNASIVTVRVLDPVTEGPLERVVLQAQLKAGTQALRDLLFELESGRPYLFVESLTVHPIRRSRQQNAGGLDIRLTLAGMRVPDDRQRQGARNG